MKNKNHLHYSKLEQVTGPEPHIKATRLEGTLITDSWFQTSETTQQAKSYQIVFLTDFTDFNKLESELKNGVSINTALWNSLHTHAEITIYDNQKNIECTPASGDYSGIYDQVFEEFTKFKFIQDQNLINIYKNKQVIATCETSLIKANPCNT